MQYNCFRKNNQLYSSFSRKTIKPTFCCNFLPDTKGHLFRKLYLCGKKICYIYTVQLPTQKLQSM